MNPGKADRCATCDEVLAGKHRAFALHYLSFAFLFSIVLGVEILIVRWASSGTLLRGDSDVIALLFMPVLTIYRMILFFTVFYSV